MVEPDSREESRRLQTLAMVLISAFGTPLMLSSVNVALPTLARALALDAVVLAWVPFAYLLGSAMFVLIAGRLADLHGRRRVFLIGTAGVMATAVAIVLTHDGHVLVALRFVQGVFTALLYATQIALVAAVFPPARRGHAIGLTVSSVYLGLTAGPLLGGVLLEIVGWQACFLIQLPFAAASLVLALWRTSGDEYGDRGARFDYAGALLYASAVALIMVGLSALPDTRGVLALLLGLVAGIGFVAVEQRAQYPMFDTRLFLGNQVFALSCLASLLIYTATFSNVVLASLYLQYLKGMAPATAGLYIMVQPLTMALFSPFMGRLSDRVEPRLLASGGMALTLFGLLALASLTQETSAGFLVAALMTTGLGFALFSAPNTNAIMGAVERRAYGSASSSAATMRLLGQMASTALVAMALSLYVGAVPITPAVHDALARAVHLSYLIAALLCAPGIVFSLARGRVHAAAPPGGRDQRP